VAAHSFAPAGGYFRVPHRRQRTGDALAHDCWQVGRVVATDSMFTLAAITATLLATTAAIRAFRAVENQSLLAIRAGKALWDEMNHLKKNLFIGYPTKMRMKICATTKP
jgi:hypothetical protein